MIQSVQNQRSALVAWLDDGNLFSINLYWVAFIKDGHCYSSSTLKWLGPFQENVFWDTGGKPVAMLDGAAPAAMQIKPLQSALPVKRPMFPLRPTQVPQQWKPVKAALPIGAWSPLDFEQWLAQ